MNKLFIKLLVFVFSVTLVFGVNQSFGQGPDYDYNILTVGDDVTTSKNNTNGYGWRYYFWKDLQTDVAFPYAFDMVGTQTENNGGNPVFPDPLFDTDHEAHWAYQAHFLGRELPEWLLNYTADIALVHAGTIEINEGNAVYVERIHKRISGIVRTLRMANPRVTILLAQLIPFNGPITPYEDMVAAANIRINDIATELADPNSPIIIVDQNTNFQTDISHPGNSWYMATTPLPNFYIPNNLGGQEMANRWRAALTANIPTPKNRWIGGSSTLWTDAANWNQGHIPLPTEDVVITSTATTWPTISSLRVGIDCRDFVMESNSQCTVTGNVVVRTEQTLIVYPGAQLNVGGDWKESESQLGGGKAAPTGALTYDSKDAYMELNCTSAFELVSVLVYPNNATLPGSRTFYLEVHNGTDYVILEDDIIEIPVDAGSGSRVNLNWNIPVTTDPVNFPHRIGIKDSPTNTAKLGREFANLMYDPVIPIGAVGSLIGAEHGDPLPDWYYWYMYDWEFIPENTDLYVSHTRYGDNSSLNFSGAENNTMIDGSITTGAGKVDHTVTPWAGYSSGAGHNTFDCLFPFKILSAEIDVNAGPTTLNKIKSFYWASADGTMGDTVDILITTSGVQRVDLNFLVQPGIDHRIGALDSDDGPQLYFDQDLFGLQQDGFDFPFPIGKYGNVTAYASTAWYYYFLYDLEVAPAYNNLNINKPGYSLASDGDIAVTNELTVEAGSFLTVSTGDMLCVGGNLNLMADATGVASFLNNGTVDIKDSVRVEQFLTENRWHYVSSPITGGVSEVYLGMYMKYWDEPTYMWNYISAINHPMTPMQGFSAWATSDYTATYEGILNDGPQSFGVVSSHDGSLGDPGYNLAGNPYASSLDWDALSGWTKTNVDNTIYFWSGNNDIAGSGTYLAYQGTGGEIPGVGIGTATSIIPPGQGFFVHATAASGTLSVDNDARVHNGQAYYKNGQVNELPLIRLQAMDQNDQFDETVIRFYENSTLQHDGEYDAYKLSGYNYPQLYSLTNEASRLAINTLPDFEEGTVIPLGFTAPEDGQYSIKLTEFANFDETTGLYLEDLLTGELYEISDSPTYSFVASSEDDPNRFLLIFKGIASDIEDLEVSEVRIFSFQKDVIITIPETAESAFVRIFDLMGKEMVSKKISGEVKTTIPVNGQKGYYVVKVQTDQEIYTEKVFIQ